MTDDQVVILLKTGKFAGPVSITELMKEIAAAIPVSAVYRPQIVGTEIRLVQVGIVSFDILPEGSQPSPTLPPLPPPSPQSTTAEKAPKRSTKTRKTQPKASGLPTSTNDPVEAPSGLKFKDMQVSVSYTPASSNDADECSMFGRVAV